MDNWTTKMVEVQEDTTPQILFVVEGFTDIRFVVALAQVCRLTMLVPKQQFRSSHLNIRLEESGAQVSVVEIDGGRIAYQIGCTRYLWKAAKQFDGIITQELLRGSLSACTVGAIQGVPAAAYMCLPPLDYFRCKRKRRQIGPLRSLAGETAIKTLMTINGRLAWRCVALGPYLEQVASRYSDRVESGYYYGVDTDVYRPCEEAEKREIRARLRLPEDAFIIFFSSRVSHEKDPETVLKAAAGARARGMHAVVLNLSGNYNDFLDLARSMSLPDWEKWVLAGPPAHPMRELPDFYRASDVLAQASLAEGLGLSPLEGLASGVPAVCTAVGGLLANLKGYVRLVNAQDHKAMEQEFIALAANPEDGRREALRGRAFVQQTWDRRIALNALSKLASELATENQARRPSHSQKIQPQKVKK